MRTVERKYKYHIHRRWGGYWYVFRGTCGDCTHWQQVGMYTTWAQALRSVKGEP